MEVLKIGAEWCEGCKVMGPRWKEIEKKHDWLKTTYYEFDDNPDIAEKYNLKRDGVLPAFIFLDKDGNELERHVGEASEEKIEEVIERLKDK